MSDAVDAIVAGTNLASALIRIWAGAGNTPKVATPTPGPAIIPVPGMTYRMGAFSTRHKAFYTHLDDVRALIRHYVARGWAGKPLNILISAPPGSGKSFLVKQLLAGDSQTTSNVPYLELNVANVGSRSDLGAAWQFLRTMASNSITP